ncbi:MAG: response regulator transcription factor [Alphaproteobacteria bacterium]|nr:response regulator transcription factor [Alphaproteobacteria bacterium]
MQTATSGARATHGLRRLLIVEDERLLRDRLLQAALSTPGWMIEAAGSILSAREAMKTGVFNAVFLDLGLPDGDGVSLIPDLLSINPACEILVITVFADEARVITSLEAGASGYILKSDLADYAERLVSFIESGGSPVSPAIARSLINRLRPAAPLKSRQTSPLSEREAEVLSLCARGLRYSEIADVLGVSSHTINAHLRSVYRKLMVTSRSEAVFEARRSGLIDG